MSPGGETEHYLMSSVLYTSHYTILRPPVLEEFSLKLIRATPRFTFTLSILCLIDVRSFNSLFHRLNNIVRLLDCPKAYKLFVNVSHIISGFTNCKGFGKCNASSMMTNIL